MESTDVAKAAIKMALSTRSEEAELKQIFRNMDVKVCAVDFGGNLVNSIEKIIERALVAAKREGVIKENVHVLEGALIGATREALSQVLQKAVGFNVGGKIGIARWGEHISVAMFFGVGFLSFNEVVIGLGHRSLPSND
ncbi:MAG: hut operon positive regulator HutP [Tepidanaerobacter acetatoxydans]|uniref:HutP family protein n=1 Tax=Tepidanaerobacter acetatoxydans TaxID=499229 RepID=UPI0026ECED39|nr:HutP family protein [Tepidanaerobacter acetatoxydans]NLU10044.1 hut operon positive regulator HutP [Tepidanaerobacter acetatoxydans]